MTLVIIGFDTRFIITKTSQESFFKGGGEDKLKNLLLKKRDKRAHKFSLLDLL